MRLDSNIDSKSLNNFGCMVKIRPSGFLFIRPSGFGLLDKFAPAMGKISQKWGNFPKSGNTLFGKRENIKAGNNSRLVKDSCPQLASG